MNSKTKLKCPIIQAVFRLVSIAFFMHIASAEIINQRSSTYQNYQYITTSHYDDQNFLDSVSNQLSNDAIQLQIIQNTVDQFAAVLSQSTHESSHRYKRGSISPPTSSSNSSRLLMIENQISNLQKQLSYLNTSKSLSTEDKNRINAIETTIRDLHITLDSLQKEYAENDSEKDKRIQNIEQKLELSVLLGIAQSINARQFSFADEQLQLLTDDSIYKKIVKKVYLQQIGNFNLLLSFGSSIVDLERKFKMYEALYYAMRTDGQADIQKLLQLSQSIRKGVCDVSTGIILENSQTFIRTLWEENEKSTLALISTTFLKNESWNWPTIKRVNEEIRKTCGFQFFGDMYKKVIIDDVWLTLNLGDVLNVSHQITIPEEQVIIHGIIFNELEQRGRLHDTNYVVPLARYMKATWEDPAFNSADWQSRYKIIINKLPSSLANIVLHSSVCIKYSHFDEYLYAEEMNEKNNVFGNYGYRSAYTWIPTGKYKSSEFKWKVSFENNYRCQISNVKYNEAIHLRYSSDDKNETYYLLVKSDPVRYWDLHVDGESVEISSHPNNFYLYADEKRDDYRRNVIAYNRTSKPSHPLKWDFTDCSEFP